MSRVHVSVGIYRVIHSLWFFSKAHATQCNDYEFCLYTKHKNKAYLKKANKPHTHLLEMQHGNKHNYLLMYKMPLLKKLPAPPENPSASVVG